MLINVTPCYQEALYVHEGIHVQDGMHVHESMHVQDGMHVKDGMHVREGMHVQDGMHVRESMHVQDGMHVREGMHVQDGMATNDKLWEMYANNNVTNVCDYRCMAVFSSAYLREPYPFATSFTLM